MTENSQRPFHWSLFDAENDELRKQIQAKHNISDEQMEKIRLQTIQLKQQRKDGDH